MTAKADPQKEARIEEICAVYRTCSEKGDEIVFSVDEMTGIQALERIAPDLALAPGKPLAREPEYKRHGTQTLIAALRVAMGSIYAHCGETRTEADFCRFIATLIEHHPGYRVYRFVADQLNTHQSEALVRLAAKLSGLNTDLGVKGERGILRSMDSRAAFLSRDDKRVVFHYTPRHASWMNQIEIWFGILAKKVVRRGNFLSQADLREKILTFIDYFNATMAKPFRWTYQGKPLVA